MAFRLELFIIHAGPPSFGANIVLVDVLHRPGKIADVADQFN
jgi:hypothetical protein